jgi:PKD repeat protein
MRRHRWLPLLALLAAIACQQAVPTVPPSIASFSASPSTVRSGEASTLSWSVTGATNLSVAPAIGDVTGTSSIVVAPAATTTYTLTATNAGGSDVESVTVTVDDTITVEGRVIGLNGRPTAGATVLASGRPTATTDAEGRFTIAAVEPPYDVVVTDPGEDAAVVYLGLTLERPTLTRPGTAPGANHSAAIAGTVSGGSGYPQPADHRTAVAFGSLETRASALAGGATGAFALPSVTWFGPTTTAGALHALQWRVGAGGLPAAFVGHGQRPLALQAGSAPYTGQDMALLPISSSSLSGTVSVPAGVTLWQRAAFVVFPEGGLLGTAGETTSVASFTYVTPVVEGATMTVAASGVGASLAETSFVVRAGLLPGATNVALPLPPVPHLVAPGPGATGVAHATTFTWTSPAGGVAVVTFSPQAAGPTLTVVTTADSAGIPNLAGLGLALPSSAPYAWSVTALPEFATVDAAAADEVGLLGSWVYGTFAAWRRDGALATSVARDFTTAP